MALGDAMMIGHINEMRIRRERLAEEAWHEMIDARDAEIKQLRKVLKQVRRYIVNCEHEPAVDIIDAALG